MHVTVERFMVRNWRHFMSHWTCEAYILCINGVLDFRVMFAGISFRMIQTFISQYATTYALRRGTV